MENKKVVINRCFGGFSLSPKAIKRLAELNGKECYFFKHDYKNDKHTSISLKEAEKDSLFFTAFSVSNPDEILPKERRGKDGTYKEFNEEYGKIDLDMRPDDRTDKHLIQVVEELGDESSGSCAELEIIEIPEDVGYEIDDYDGMESIHEIHRSWS